MPNPEDNKTRKLEEFIWISTLENALKFDGRANQGAIVGKLFVFDPSLKERMKEVAPMIGKIVSSVNSLSVDQQEKELLKLVPDFFDKQKSKKEQRKKEARELPPLKDAEEGNVKTRMPPGPSKYPHIGHAVSFGINYLYAKEYNGKCILRFDDTNPEVEKQEFVDAIIEDITEYMGMKPDEIVFASDSMPEFYSYVDRLIEEHHVYACSCPSEKIANARRNMKDCPHRKQTRNETKEIWEQMRLGKKKDYALRLRIDMEHKNAVMRDPVIFRVIDKPHYRQKKKYKVWPTYDFESPVVDGMNGITHVLRSNEFDSRIELHHYIAKLLGFSEIPYKHYGRINITGTLTQGREIRKKIDDKEFIGWDDPRLVTLKALKRRGIVREAIVNVVKMSGLSKQNTNIDFSVVAAENRKILDNSAKRFFFIKKPKKIIVEGAPELEHELNLHPEHSRNGRPMKTHNEFYIEEDDFKAIKDGEVCRLMDCLNYVKKGKNIEYHSTPHSEFKGKGKHIIHWLPIHKDMKLIEVEVMMPNSKVIMGLAEPTIKILEEGDVIQFERFGFCRLDSKKKGKYHFWYTHD